MDKFWEMMRERAATYFRVTESYEPVKAPENAVLIFRTPLEKSLLGEQASAALTQPEHVCLSASRPHHGRQHPDQRFPG